ncbi:MAG: hypothetical protein JWL67_2602 [Solirubrobacterales bacterium]|nr:hypothetical protein [Solirubrobacterales bacterium]
MHPSRPDLSRCSSAIRSSIRAVRDVIALLRLNYDRALARNGMPGTPEAEPRAAGSRG